MTRSPGLASREVGSPSSPHPAPALDTLMNCNEGNGFEVWRRFAQDNLPKTPGHRRTRYINLLEAKNITATTFKGKAEQWEKQLKDYLALPGATPVDDETKLAVLEQVGPRRPS